MGAAGRRGRLAIGPAVDAVGLAIGVVIGVVIGIESLAWLSALAVSTFLFLILLGAYRARLHLPTVADPRIIAAATGAALVLGSTTSTLRDEPVDLGVGGSAAALLALVLAAARATAIRVGARIGGRQRTLVIGAGRVGQLAVQRLRRDASLRLEPVGFLDNEPMRPPTACRPFSAPAGTSSGWSSSTASIMCSSLSRRPRIACWWRSSRGASDSGWT